MAIQYNQRPIFNPTNQLHQLNQSTPPIQPVNWSNSTNQLYKFNQSNWFSLAHLLWHWKALPGRHLQVVELHLGRPHEEAYMCPKTCWNKRHWIWYRKFPRKTCFLKNVFLVKRCKKLLIWFHLILNQLIYQGPDIFHAKKLVEHMRMIPWPNLGPKNRKWLFGILFLVTFSDSC